MGSRGFLEKADAFAGCREPIEKRLEHKARKNLQEADRQAEGRDGIEDSRLKI